VGNFVHHLSGGMVAGAVCSGVAYYGLRVPLADATAFGVIACVGSLLPDIDSPHSKPNDMAVGLASVVVPIFAIQGMGYLSPSRMILTALALYAVVKYGLRFVMNRFCVHRGIFHSIPAAVVWGALVYWGFRFSPALIKNAAASSALVGFVVHLVIDEMFSFVNFEGVRISPKQSFGTALKFTAPSLLSTTAAYIAAVLLLYACLRDMKLV
jgi:membrane-bound metal-dependent hydrolase YbcI (DUF457 family)